MDIPRVWVEGRAGGGSPRVWELIEARVCELIEDYEGDPEELGSERGHALHPHTAAGSKHGAMQSPCLLLEERHRAVGTVHHNTGSK